MLLSLRMTWRKHSSFWPVLTAIFDQHFVFEIIWPCGWKTQLQQELLNWTHLVPVHGCSNPAFRSCLGPHSPSHSSLLRFGDWFCICTGPLIRGTHPRRPSFSSNPPLHFWLGQMGCLRSIFQEKVLTISTKHTFSRFGPRATVGWLIQLFLRL
jgi:hypothetical protein